MPQTINTNIASLNAQRNTSNSQLSLSTSMQRLSSGLRVNSAKDDAAGLAIAERMNAQVRGMNVAVRNANDAISLAQTAEGAIGKLTDMAQRMRELAVQSANGTNTDDDRTSLDQEYQQLAQEITRTIAATTFNGLAILAGDAGALDFQVGANSGQTVSITTTDLSANADVTAVTGGDILDATNAGMTVHYAPAGDVGADRIVNAVAAWEKYGRSAATPLIVVDFGTGTTFDAISSGGEYLGGVICPGINISAEALFQRAARLPRVDVRKPAEVIGQNTVNAMQSGLFYGYVEMVDGLVRRMRTALPGGDGATVIATGGLADILSGESTAIQHVDQNLTLDGLRLIWNRNRP